MLLINLRAARINAGMTSKEAAGIAGVHFQTLSKYEHDSSDIPVSLLNRLSTIYQVPVDNIFLGKQYELTRTIKRLREAVK